METLEATSRKNSGKTERAKLLRRKKSMRLLESINLAVLTSIALAYLASGAHLGRIPIGDEDFEVGLWGVKDVDGEEYNYADWSPEKDPFDKIARVAKIIAAGGALGIFAVIVGSVIAIVRKWKPFHPNWIWVEGLVFSGYTGVIVAGWYNSENGEYLKVFLHETRTHKELIEQSPLWQTFQLFFAICIFGFILTTWVLIDCDERLKELADNEADEEDCVDFAPLVAEKPSNEELNQVREENEQFTELDLRALIPDFQVDAYSLLALTTTKPWMSRIKTRKGRILVQFSCITCCLTQIIALVYLATDQPINFMFGGNEENLGLRILLMCLITILLFGDMLQTGNRAGIPLTIPTECFRDTKPQWIGYVERAVTLIFFGAQLTVSLGLLPQLCLTLMQIEDKEGVPGIIIDFTAYVILIDMDSIVIPGIIALVSRFDETVTETAIETVAEDFFAMIKAYDTPSREYFKKFILNLILFTLFLVFVLINYPLIIYRFKDQAYFVWADSD